jgi:aryl-alcohol dehydrogenase-like predicted oxidoreductase
MLRRQWAESQANLGPALRLYQGTAIGLSTSGARQPEVIRRALAVRVEGAPLFDAVQTTWNPLEPSAGPALVEAHGAGLGVIVKEALANGRLTERNTDPAFAPQRALLAAQAARLGCSLDALAIAAALAQPWATAVLSGAATAGQVSSNLAALAVPWDAEAAAALATLAEPAEAYWQTRAALPWN